MANLPKTRRVGMLRLALLIGFAAAPATAQTEFVARDFFPADLEFKELGEVRTDVELNDASALAQVDQGDLLLEAGCQRYARRDYDVKAGGSLSIEVATLKDGKGSYSLLTLLREGEIRDGPPGQHCASLADGIVLTQGPFWARIRAADRELCRKVSMSVSHRIGERDPSLPSLAGHLPEAGRDAASIRYFLGPLAFAGFGWATKGVDMRPTRDQELLQARYDVEGRSGVLCLLGFPTGQLAEEYFDGLPGNADRSAAAGLRVYARRVGPMVGILEGTFTTEQADKILGSLEYQYTIRWIYDKNNRSSATVWGVPVGLLGTVVRSLILVAILCGASIVAGFAMAVFRVLLRGYAPNNFLDRPERTEVIRLKLDEN